MISLDAQTNLTTCNNKGFKSIKEKDKKDSCVLFFFIYNEAHRLKAQATTYY